MLVDRVRQLSPIISYAGQSRALVPRRLLLAQINIRDLLFRVLNLLLARRLRFHLLQIALVLVASFSDHLLRFNRLQVR